MNLNLEHQEYDAKLQDAIDQITDLAKNRYKLDFFPMIYEIVPSEALYTFGAYGMPTRYNHWSFGKSYHQMKAQYDHGLSRIYELVINSDPCYAFLLDGNSLLQNKLIVAHVLGHCDFFKNNYLFDKTRRDMVESMASFAQRVHGYEGKYGRQRVERFLDAAIGLSMHSTDRHRNVPRSQAKKEYYRTPGEFDDIHAMGAPVRYAEEAKVVPVKRFPEHPYEDILEFFLLESRELEDWQRDILTGIREEALYFYPQMQTKIMNEGWASYWHAKILHDLDLDPGETVDFAKLHAGVLHPHPYQLNPYYVGYTMFKAIEKTWDSPRKDKWDRPLSPGGQGMSKLFEIRETENDVSFLRNYLTAELVEEMGMFLYQVNENHYRRWAEVTEDRWEAMRDYLCWQKTNMMPKIRIVDAAYSGGGILLEHDHDGIDMDIKYAGNTLPYVSLFWGGRKVFLNTVYEGHRVTLSYNPLTLQVSASRGEAVPVSIKPWESASDIL